MGTQKVKIKRAADVAEEVIQAALPVDDEPTGSPEPNDSERAADEPEGPPPEEVQGEVVEDETPATSIISMAADPDSLARLATPEQIEQAIVRVLARADAITRFRVAMLSMTNYRDWYAHRAEGDPDGSPYLAETGSEKIIHAFSIEVQHDGGVLQSCPPDIGGFEVVYNGQMRALVFSDIFYPVTGSRWSDDGFFTKGGRQRPDPGDVRKAALTNFYNRGIKTVCGLRTITWDELEAIPHLANLRNRVVTIGFESGGRSGSGGGKSAPGEKSQIAAGPHILVKLQFGDEKNKARIKKLKPWNWNNTDTVWEVGYSKENLARIADFHAEDSNAVRFKLVNVAEEDLP